MASEKLRNNAAYDHQHTPVPIAQLRDYRHFSMPVSTPAPGRNKTLEKYLMYAIMNIPTVTTGTTPQESETWN